VIKSIIRWIWFKLYSEDLFVMLGQRDRLEALNGVHCEFIAMLEGRPELKPTLAKHQKDRLDALSLGYEGNMSKETQ